MTQIRFEGLRLPALSALLRSPVVPYADDRTRTPTQPPNRPDVRSVTIRAQAANALGEDCLEVGGPGGGSFYDVSRQAIHLHLLIMDLPRHRMTVPYPDRRAWTSDEVGRRSRWAAGSRQGAILAWRRLRHLVGKRSDRH
jgi:hypothetical protein